MYFFVLFCLCIQYFFFATSKRRNAVQVVTLLIYHCHKRASEMTQQTWRSCHFYHFLWLWGWIQKSSSTELGRQADVRVWGKSAEGNSYNFRKTFLWHRWPILLIGHNRSCQYYLTSKVKESTWRYKGYQVSIFPWPLCSLKLNTIQTFVPILLYPVSSFSPSSTEWNNYMLQRGRWHFLSRATYSNCNIFCNLKFMIQILFPTIIHLLSAW